MDDLIAFLTARYDEAETAAKAAGSGEWEYRDTWVMSGHYEIADVFGIPDTDAVGTHIAASDPAAKLRDITAKRAILAEHDPGHDPCDAHDASMRTITCDTVRHLGTEFSTHPGYRQEWAP